jgi:lipopolysaccharide transport system permease protein
LAPAASFRFIRAPGGEGPGGATDFIIIVTNTGPAASTFDSAAIPVVRIGPARSWAALNLAELVDYRELLYFLVWRDIKVRYKQTALGFLWALLQPLFMMLVFTLFFGRLGKLPSDGMPYSVFTLCALLPWQLFAHALSESSNSLVANERLISKVYFPRLLVPLAAVVGGLADFGVAFLLLVAVMAFYGLTPGIAVVALPLLVLFAIATAFSVGLWLSALNVQYRDVRYTLVFLTQLWMFATPVAYSSSLVPAAWRPLYGLNPMVGVVEGFRWALLNRSTPPGAELFVSVAAVAALLVSGLYYFRRVERTFADVI